ncbi:MFS transporter [Actinomadura alba]|uniref:MFS transporter n=1 Tax=Actinomadura alba TaxID=406431 RepID=A0ABR7LXA4_9ACTN|nr:MFS transporter [Actinomadura alba]
MTIASGAKPPSHRERIAVDAARVSAPLRGNPRYVRYFFANQISSAGTAMATGAVAYAVLTTGGGAAGIAMVFMGQMVATIVMSPIGGTLADRLPRVRVIVIVQIIVGALVAFQAGLIAVRQAGVANLALIAAAVNVAAAFSSPARVGLVSALVPKQQLPEANALAELGHYAIIMTGPAVGGFVVGVAGPAWGVGCNAVSFWLSAALMHGIKAPPLERKPQRFLADVAEGWGVVSRTPWIVTNVLGSAGMVSCWHVAYGIVGLTYVQTHLGGPASWGLVASSLGTGMVAGSLIALAWTPRRAGYVNCIATTPMALPGLCMAAGMPLPVIMGAVVLAAMGLSIAAVTWRSLIQQTIPDAQQGRVAAWFNFGEIGFTPIAYLLVGPSVAVLGLRGTLLACAIGIVAATLAPLAHPDVRQLTLLQTPEPPLSAATSTAAVSSPDRRAKNARPHPSSPLRSGDHA